MYPGDKPHRDRMARGSPNRDHILRNSGHKFGSHFLMDFPSCDITSGRLPSSGALLPGQLSVITNCHSFDFKNNLQARICRLLSFMDLLTH